MNSSGDMNKNNVQSNDFYERENILIFDILAEKVKIQILSYQVMY